VYWQASAKLSTTLPIPGNRRRMGGGVRIKRPASHWKLTLFVTVSGKTGLIAHSQVLRMVVLNIDGVVACQ